MILIITDVHTEGPDPTSVPDEFLSYEDFAKWITVDLLRLRDAGATKVRYLTPGGDDAEAIGTPFGWAVKTYQITNPNEPD